jgi:serine/threonine protein kinase
MGRLYGPLYATAPEVLRGSQYESSADIYSYGILMWDLARFWMSKHTKNSIPKALVDIINRCLCSEKNNRPTAFEVVRGLEKLGDLFALDEHVEFIEEKEAVKVVVDILVHGDEIMKTRSLETGFLSFSW